MTMRSILSALGSNLSLRDKKLIVTKGKLLSALGEVSSAVRTEKSRLEPQMTATNKDIMKDSAVNKSLLPRYPHFRTVQNLPICPN
jgi:hypothetical protein